jgi:hypothetical protein
LRQAAAVALGLVAIATFLAGCGKVAADTCTKPSGRCTCANAADRTDRRVVLLASQRGVHVAGAAQDLGDAKGDLPLLGLDDAPLVVMATADAVGDLDLIGQYDLNGEGSSRGQIEDNATFQGACLDAAVEGLPGGGEPGDLLRALPDAIAEAERGSPDEAAVVVVGFGHSKVAGQPPIAEWDLTTESAREHAAAILVDLGMVPKTKVPVVFVDPGDGLEPGVDADVAAFVEDQLCPVIGPKCTAARAIR